MQPKYKIKLTEGCTAFDFSINNISLSEYKEEELNQILDYLFVKVKEGIRENTIQFSDVVHLFQYNDFRYDKLNCEQCGDSVSTTTWEI